jgi:hypothetical protein
MNNNREHRIIKAFPTQVFDGLELTKQKINKVYYPFYKVGTIVIKRPEVRVHSHISYLILILNHMLLVILEVESID